MEIEQLEDKFKLGQERRAADKERILRAAKQGRSYKNSLPLFAGAHRNRGSCKAERRSALKMSRDRVREISTE
jgi:hypothetical protein